MTRQTGGFDFAEISTKSSSASLATARASSIGTTPLCSPSASIKRTSLAEILPLILSFETSGCCGLPRPLLTAIALSPD